MKVIFRRFAPPTPRPPAPTWLGLLLLAALALPACGNSGVLYSLSSPQVSMDNRYVGPDLEIQFRFTQRTIQLEITNSGSDVMVNWNQATFLNPDGRAVRLEPVGAQPIYTLPSRSRTSVELTLGQWPCGSPRLWHRRVAFQRALVFPQHLQGPQPTVRVLLPVTKVQYDGQMAQEMLEFVFTVKAQDASAAQPAFPMGGIR